MNNSVTIGIDNRDGTYYVARVDHHTGRPDIKALIRFDADHFNGHHLLEGNQIVISIPDDQTMIKQFLMSSSENANRKILFELETALIDNSDEFLFDIIETKLENFYLGLTVRKKITKELIEPFIKQNGDLKFSTSGVMRAAGLARGFLTYCQHSGGDFGAIVDFAENCVSIAFYYKQQIVDLGSLPLTDNFKYDDKSFQKLTVELKTLLNFKIASLLEKGISVPLSKIFVVGEFLTENRLESLTKILKVAISRPEINRGFIRDNNNSQEISLDKYLVALGLTVI